MKAILHPEAEQEFIEALGHYQTISPELGTRFYDVLSVLLQEAGEHPRRYRLYEPPVRRLMARGFPYAVLYVEKADRVLILAVMHLKRQPGYWRNRLNN